jgi:putative transposase
MKSKRHKKGQKSLRKGRFSEKGQFYFITTCCYGKQTLFMDDKNVNIIFKTLKWLEKNNYIDLHFCTVMPDHLHLVFQLTGKKSLSEVIKSFKQYTGKSIKQNNNLKNYVWQINTMTI